MLVIDFLKKRPIDEIVYIGSSLGSGWLYIGTAMEAISFIPIIDAYLNKCIETRVKGKKNCLKLNGNLINQKKELLKEIQDGNVDFATKEESNEAAKKLALSIRSLQSELDSAPDMLRDLRRMKKEYTSVADREEVSSYEHTSYPAGTCIIFKGANLYSNVNIETSTVWEIDEIETFKKKMIKYMERN